MKTLSYIIIGIMLMTIVTAGDVSITQTAYDKLSQTYCDDKPCTFSAYQITENSRILRFVSGSITCPRTRTAVFNIINKKRIFNHYDYQDWNVAYKLCIEKKMAQIITPKVSVDTGTIK